MEGVECAIVCHPVLLPDHYRRVAHGKKDHVHKQTSHSPVAVGKRVNVNKRGVEIGGHGQCASAVGKIGVHVAEKFPHELGDVRRVSANRLRAYNVVTQFVRAWPLPAPPTLLVIGSIGQELVSLKDKILRELQTGDRKRPRPLPGGLEVLYLKERPHVTGEGDDTTVLKDLVSVVVRDRIVFDLSGVIGIVEDEVVNMRLARRGGEISPPRYKLFIACEKNVSHQTHALKIVGKARAFGRLTVGARATRHLAAIAHEHEIP